MSYLEINDNKFEEDLLKRKEFIENEYKKNKYTLAIDEEIKQNNILQLTNYQKFVTNFINPNTKYDRLLLIHSTGVGKTITALSTAINFINLYKEEKLIDNKSEGMIYIIGFTKNVFKKELFNRKEFGIVTDEEIAEMVEYKNNILKFNQESDIIRLKELKMKYSRRLTSRRGNGYFEFIGYKELVNKLIIKNQLDIKLQLNNIKTEKELNYLINQGIITLNIEFLEKFNKSLIICDEIHNVYNSLYTNNWGLCLSIIFNYYKSKKSLKVLLLSATPINNNPIEIISLINLLNGDVELTKKDLFDKDNNLKPESYKLINKYIKGKISYLKDMDILSYPTKNIVGESIPKIPYLKFIKCPMSDLHFKTYIQVSHEYNIKKDNSETINEEDENINLEELNDEISNINSKMKEYPINLELQNRFLNDFVIPNPENNNRGLYLKTDILKKIQNASLDWKTKNEITLTNDNKLFKNTINGDVLLEKNIKKYSTKFYKMLELIKEIILNKKGKIFLYHNFIQVSGINFIANILRRNGIIMLDEQPTKLSRCNICYKYKYEKHTNHEFHPIRFFMVNSNIQKNIIDKHIDSFNLANNVNGEEIRIILGSKAIKESYNLKAIQNLILLHQPDNISTLIQIYGRAIRKNSHIDLPTENRKVNIYMLVSTIPDYKQNKKKYIYSYEEMKYKYKLEIYKVIQKIMNIFIENAVDRNINYNINFPKYDKVDNNDLYYIKPLHTQDLIKIDYKNINLATFQSYYYQEEINYCKHLIKKIFIENKIWTYEDLKQEIHKLNTSTTNAKISEYSIIIALNFLVYNRNNEHIIVNQQNKGQEEEINNVLINNLFNPNEKIIVDRLGNKNYIIYKNNYYILIPFSNSNSIYDNIEYDILYRNYEYIPEKSINLEEILNSDFNLNNYEYLKEKFIEKYKNKKINKLVNIIAEYDFNFHIQLIEEVIEYFFNLYTNEDYKININHDLYLKVLYFYNKFNIIIFANKMDQDLQEIYGKYVLSTMKMNFTISSSLSESTSSSDNHNYNNLLNQLSSESQSSSDNNNEFYFNFYNQAVNDVSSYLLTRKKRMKIFDYLLPIGHIYDKNFKFYHPSKYWFNKLDYNKLEIKFVENKIIIGYLEKSKLGFDIIFKLRNPRTKKEHRDMRNVETGNNCINKDKNDLIEICKKLDIDLTNIVLRKNKLCNFIKTELINRELEERKQMSNIKWFYFYWELN